MANRRFIDFPIASTSGDTDIILIWQDGANKQTTKATFLSGLPENLDELNDVAISGLTNGQILRYDSVTGKWENTDQGNLDLNDLNDVSIVSPSNGQVLVYNSSTSKWENSSGGFVPYVGAVTTVDLGAQGLRAGYVRFDTTVAGVPQEQGVMFWDADDETVDIILNGYTMKIGEDLFYPVKNQTGSTIAKGVAVRFAGTLGASGRLLIEPFIADGSVPSSRFMGVTAEEILNGEDGKVLYFGRVRGIDTDAFNEGDILYASTTVAGGYQTAIPLPPNNIVEVAAVISKSATVGTIFVRPTLGSNINKDEGVKITSVADKNLLQYQSGTALWENKTLAQVIGGTSAQFVKGDGSLDSTSYGTGTVTSVGLSSATSGVTIGSSPVTTSGTITLAIATASGSQNGLLSSTDWTTFNSKQNALTNPVTGTGTTNYLPKFTGSTTIGNSIFTEVGGNTLRIIAANATLRLTGSREYLLQTVDADGRFRIYDQTAALERVTLTSTGNVGIGTNAPLTLNSLQVSRNINDQNIVSVENVNIGTGAYAELQIRNTNANNSTSLRVMTMGTGYTTAGGFVRNSGVLNADVSLTGGLSIMTRAAADIRFYTNGHTNERWRITSAGILQSNGAQTIQTSSGALTLQPTGGVNLATSSGNVGIGTASPSAQLNVGHESHGVGISYLGSSALPSLAGIFTSDGTAGGQTGYGSLLVKARSDFGGFYSINFFTAASDNTPVERIRITSNGTLGFNGSAGVGNAGLDKMSMGYLNSNYGWIQTWSGTPLLLNPSGNNVLIGTTTDNGARLQVSGTATFSSGVTATELTLNKGASDTIGAGSYVYYSNVGGTRGAVHQLNAAFGLDTFTFDGSTWSRRMTITSSGNVGIGTASPVRKLDVNGFFRVTDGTVNTEIVNGGGVGFIGTATNHPLDIQTNNTERMRITSGGNVLIGTTTNGSSKLKINGLPTSSAGLASGDVWNDSGTLKIA